MKQFWLLRGTVTPTTTEKPGRVFGGRQKKYWFGVFVYVVSCKVRRCSGLFHVQSCVASLDARVRNTVRVSPVGRTSSGSAGPLELCVSQFLLVQRIISVPDMAPHRTVRLSCNSLQRFLNCVFREWVFTNVGVGKNPWLKCGSRQGKKPRDLTPRDLDVREERVFLGHL